MPGFSVIFLSFAGVTLASLAVAWAATGAVTAWLRRRAILDHPNERSSHDAPFLPRLAEGTKLAATTGA